MRRPYVFGLLLLVVLVVPVRVRAQTATDSARAVLTRLFNGMRAGDSTAVLAAFHPGARLQSAATGRDGKPRLVDTPVAAFAHAVGTPHAEVWDERVYDVEVKVDGAMATAWVPYTFYAGQTLSHCGVNSAQLWRGPTGWAIVSLLDTRRRTGCPPATELAPGRN